MARICGRWRKVSVAVAVGVASPLTFCGNESASSPGPNLIDDEGDELLEVDVVDELDIGGGAWMPCNISSIEKSAGGLKSSGGGGGLVRDEVLLW